MTMATFSKAKNIFVVINQDNTKKAPLSKSLGEEVLSKLSNYGSFYTILHDRFSESEGEEETIHRHLLLEGCDQKSSDTWLEIISLLFGVPKNCVQIESVKNLRKCGRYLVHRDDEWKYQFPAVEVQTNNKKQLEAWLQGGKVTQHVIVKFKGNKRDFLMEFGADATKKYWPLVEEMRDTENREIKAEHERDVVSWLKRHLIDLYGTCERISKLAAEGTKSTPKGSQNYALLWSIYNEAENSRKAVLDYINNGVIEG